MATARQTRIRISRCRRMTYRHRSVCSNAHAIQSIAPRLPGLFSGESQGASRRSPSLARAVAQASRHGSNARRIRPAKVGPVRICRPTASRASATRTCTSSTLIPHRQPISAYGKLSRLASRNTVRVSSGSVSSASTYWRCSSSVSLGLSSGIARVPPSRAGMAGHMMHMIEQHAGEHLNLLGRERQLFGPVARLREAPFAVGREDRRE